MAANRILNNLWMGSAPPESDQLQKDFDCLVLCAVEYQTAQFPGMDVSCIRLHDDGKTLLTDKDKRRAIKLAYEVIENLKQKKKVLVTCMQGLNRSGLIVALTLMIGGNFPLGQVVGMIREQRGPHALSNADFVKFLETVAKAQSVESSGLEA
jgi:protein-tyrosine phosphatase